VGEPVRVRTATHRPLDIYMTGEVYTNNNEALRS